MFRRISYISFIAILIGALVYFYFQVNQHSNVETETNLIEILPNNPAIIMEIPKLSSIAKNDNLDTEMWKSLRNLSNFDTYATIWCKWDTLSASYPDLKNWSNNSSIASFHLVGKKAEPFLAVKFNNKATVKVWNTLIESKQLPKEKEYNGVSIYKFDTDFAQYAYIYKGYFAVSSSSILLEQSIRAIQNTNKADEDLENLRKTKGDGSDINIYVNYVQLNKIIVEVAGAKSDFCKCLSNLGDWGELDYSVGKSDLIFNGFSSYTTEDYWQIFSQQDGVKMNIHEAIPAYSKGFTVFSIDDIKLFRKDYETYLQHSDLFTSYQNALKTTEKQGVKNLQLTLDQLIEHEIAYCHNDLTTSKNEALVIIKTHSASSALESLKSVLSDYTKNQGKQLNDYKSKLSIDSETNVDLYRFPFENCISTLYGQAFSPTKAKYFCLYNNYIIFGAERFSIKKAIMANILKQTFANDADFVKLYSSFSAKNSIFYFANISNVIPNIQKNIGETKSKNLGLTSENTSNFYALAYQMVSSDKYIYNSILIDYNSKLRDKPQTVWSSQLDAAPVGKPQFVKNHYTNESEICVQDALNNLYLISNSGRIIWKKPIGERIISDIHQIDYFRNNKLQLLFNTPSKLWLLDRDGNFVERYPIAFSSPASTGLSLFDYNNDRNYRIFVPTEDKHIYLYSKEGNINKDFKFKTSEYPLTMPIQHFRVKEKDYLVFADKNHVYILNRKGQRRIKVKEQFSASPHNIFYYGYDDQPFIATTDITGSIMKIYFDGSVNKLKLPEVDANHYFALEDLKKQGSNNYIVVDKNKMTVYNYIGHEIYSKQIEKGDLSRPYFYKFAANVTKIGLLNKAKNEIYLFNGTDGETYKDFPLIGTSPFSIGFLSTSAWRFNLVVGGENGVLYNYKVK